MSKANGSESGDEIKQGLGKLASPAATAIAESPPSRAPGKWDRAKLYAKRTIFVAAALLCIFIFSVVGIFLRNPMIRSVVATILGHPIQVIQGGGDPTAVYSVGTFFPQHPKTVTVLVLGSDHDTIGIRKPGHVAVPQDVMNAPGRSDAIMLAKFELDGDTVSSLNVLSIPRDTRVRVPGKGIHKINAAHAYGGPELTCATIQSVFGITPDYFIDLNFEGFQQIVDAVGGVDVTVHPQANGKGLDYDDNWGHLHIHLKPGFQHLNGYKAMGYVRFRHTDNDLARAQRQHEFLEALRGKVTDPRNFMALPGVATAVTNNLHTNLTTDQILTLANVARKAPKDAICIDTLPVIEGKTFVYVDKRKGADVVRKMFFKDKQLAEVPINTPESDAAAPRHRRHRTRDTDAPEAQRHRSHSDGAPAGASTVTDAASPSQVIRPAASPDRSPDGGAQPNSPAPRDVPSSQESGGDDHAPPAPKARDGMGASYGALTPVVRA